MIKQIVNSLFDIMRPHFKGFPNDYFVLDVETTGVRMHTGKTSHYDGDMITELGFCHVRDSKPVDYAGLILNWYAMPTINPQMLTQRLEQTKLQVEVDRNGESTGKTYHMSPERMQKEGADPIETLRAFSQLLHEARAQKVFYVAHNGYFFDAKMLEDHFDFWAREPFKFGDFDIADTGMIVKGAQANMIPWGTDTARSWSVRTYTNRLKGVRWSLDKYAVPKFNLEQKYNLDMSQAHGAGFDCFVTHLLFEELKAVAAGTCEEPPICE